MSTEEDLEYLKLRKINESFDLSYVKQVLRIGKHQAQRVVDLGIERGHFRKTRNGTYKLIRKG